MVMKLSQTFKINGQEMEVFVDYEDSTNTVEKILSISMTSCGDTVDVSELMIRYFETDLNKIIDSIDWRDVWIENVVENAFK